MRAVAALTSADVPLRELFAKLAQTLSFHFDAASVTIATVHDEGNRVEYAMEDGVERPPGNLFETDEATSQALDRGAKLLYFRAEEWAAPAGFESAVFVPILFVGKCIGVIGLESRERNAFDARDCSLLEACGLYVGAWLYDRRGREEATRLERIATTDALTELSNRRGFDEGLAAEWRRCRRHGIELSLLLIDVDYFKAYNDCYGHVPGDECLQQVAKAIAGRIKRPGDIAARYGGEEFAVILPATDRKGAIAVAEAIREAVAALAIPHRGSSLGRVSISAGVMTALGEDALSAEEFLRGADAMLYAAKEAGRNRVFARDYRTEAEPSLHAAAGDDGSASNIPPELTTFVGRERELAEAKRLLDSSRIVTLLGTGGAGKTRLSQRLAAASLGDYPGGVWFVDLSPLTDRELVAVAALSAMRVSEKPSGTATHALVDFLRDRKALLVLDNCEHLIAEAAALADAVHRGCPRVRILATSREPLAIQGEAVYRLPPLSSAEAARLFVERANAAVSSFAQTDENAEAIASVCKRLDGIPLAIELVAARVRVMPVEELSEHLEDRVMQLASGNRTAQPRQQTLAGLIGWSYELLSEEERRVFRRLSVLVSDWPLEAAIAIGGDALAIGQLVDKSLIAADVSGSLARYRMLETTRAYALERAKEAGELAECAQKHAEFWCAYAVKFETTWETGRWTTVRQDIARNYDNLRAALTWCLSERHDIERGAQLAHGLELYWSELGPAREGRYWYEQALAYPELVSPKLRGKVLLGLSGMALLQGDYAAMRQAASVALATFEELGEENLVARARNDMAIVHFYAGEYAEAKAEYLNVLDLWRRRGDKFRESIQLANLAELTASYEMDFDAADEYYAQALAVFEDMGTSFQRGILLSDWSESSDFMGDSARAIDLVNEALGIFEGLGSESRSTEALVRLSTYFVHQKDYDRGRSTLRRALQRFEQDVQHDYLVRAIDAACELAAETGENEKAARLAGFGDRLRTAKKIARGPAHQRGHDAVIGRVRGAIGEEKFEREFTNGTRSSATAAIALAKEA